MQIWLSWKRPWLLICSLKIGYSNSLRSQILQINFSAGNTTTRRTRQEETPYSQLNILPHQPPWLLSPLPFFSSIFPSQLLTVSSLKYGPPSHGWTPSLAPLYHFSSSTFIPSATLVFFFYSAQWIKRTTSCSKGIIQRKIHKSHQCFCCFSFRKPLLQRAEPSTLPNL